MSWYFYYQLEPKTVWLPALADERANILRDRKPALCTVLDVNSTFEEDMTSEQRAAVKHRGPLYIDLDSDNIETAIEQAKKLLTLIKSKGVELNTLRYYLSGKKGVHVIMDPAIFMPKVNPNGIVGYPAILKEMVWNNLFVDDVDCRVWSSGKGRMLRCPNIKRDDNGAYKVSVTADEIMSLTPEKYAELCSTPRNEVPIDPPKFCPDLGLAFSVAQDKVAKGLVRKKSKKNQSDGLARFKGEWPETLKIINAGVGLREGVGYNQVAMQVAITGCALGFGEDKILADCEGLIESHIGDSSRYGTPAKRRSFLREMIRYVDDSPVYEYSPGAVINLLEPSLRANADVSFGEWQPDAPRTETVVAEDGTVTEVEVKEEEDEGASIRMSENGIFVRTDDGYKCVCDLGLKNPVSMCELNAEHIGYELDVTLDGKSKGKRFIPMSALATKGQFNNWALTLGASMRGTDAQTSSLADIFRRRSTKTVYAVEREGIDIVTPPGAKNADDYDVIWASPQEVKCSNPNVNYRFHGVYSAQGTYHSDLMNAPDLTVEDESFIADLLTVNTQGNLAKMLGWFSAAFLTQLIRKKFKRFPSLQIHGQAGSGKSMSVILLNHMHYYMTEPRQFSVAGQTNFPIIAAVASSASIPLVFEELKSRQLTKHAKDFLQNILRSNYTADQLSRGGLTRDKTMRELTVTDFQNAAPVVFVGEALEDQAALLERCVVVALSKSNRIGRDQQFGRCLDKATTMGRLGKLMAESAMSLDREKLYATVTDNFKAITGKVSQAMADEATRPAFNLAVTLTGLDFLKSVLNQVFGNTFDAQIDEMRNAILDNVMDSIPKNMSEASRVLDTMAALTRHTDVQYQLINGIDYTVSNDGKTIDLKMRSAYEKYVRYQRSLGMEVLYDNYNTFQVSMGNYSGVVKRACPENERLFDSPKAVIFRFSCEHMEREGVDAFAP